VLSLRKIHRCFAGCHWGIWLVTVFDKWFFSNLAGMEKINFSGGEPFIEGHHGKFVGEMVKYCKQELGLSVSIVSNGSLIKEQWFKDYGGYIVTLQSKNIKYSKVEYKISREYTRSDSL
jgi:organic radical activating enzyme